ncbi:MAG: Crp/Fnr family transcriptional regulator [Nitrosomonadales bacterium]|nr:Crp/Fnr family transcriptional regulator [Nitrosomonadales bacterium]
MTCLHHPHQNNLLAALAEEEYATLHAHLELVEMPLGHVIYEPGIPQAHVYFPTSMIVTLFNVMEDGATTEIAMVGNEGVVGTHLFMGGETTTNSAVVLTAGHAYQLPAQILKDEFCINDSMRHLLLCYTQTQFVQVAQTAVCNRHHSVDQQLCRWLLLNLDRLPSNELIMTQEMIANSLGVRRESITEAAGKLQQAGLIEYHRGHITILDREGLEDMTCECYALVKTESDRLLQDAATT